MGGTDLSAFAPVATGLTTDTRFALGAARLALQDVERHVRVGGRLPHMQEIGRMLAQKAEPSVASFLGKAHGDLIAEAAKLDAAITALPVMQVTRAAEDQLARIEELARTVDSDRSAVLFLGDTLASTRSAADVGLSRSALDGLLQSMSGYTRLLPPL